MALAPAAPPRQATAPAGRGIVRLRPRSLTVAVVAAGALPSLLAAAAVATRAWYPASDQALELLRIADVGTRHTPVLGVYSRWGWAHPGPLLFYLLAPFERIGGATGVLVGTGLLNAAAAGGAVGAAAWSRGRVVAAAVAVPVLGLQLGLGLSRLVDPWNPTVAVLAWVAFAVCCWLAVVARPGLLVAAVVAGSFSVQAHVGYLLLVGAPLALATGSLGWRALARGLPGPGRSPAAALGMAAVVGLLLWMPPLWQQLTGEPGNLGAIARYARSPQEPPVGAALALGSMGAHLRPVGPWLTGRDANDLNLARTGSTIPAAATLVGAAGLCWLAHRRRPEAGTAVLGALTALAVSAAVVASARVTGLYAPYVVLYWRGVAALVVLALVWPAAALVHARVLGAWRPGPGVGRAAAVSALVLVGTLSAASGPVEVPVPRVSTALGHLLPQVERSLDPDRSYLVRGQDLRTLGAPITGLFVNLERRGWHVAVDDEPLAPLTVGTRRTAGPGEVDGVIYIVDLTSLYGGWEPPAHARLIAEFDPLSAGERGRALLLESRIRAATVPAVEGPLYVQSKWWRDRLVDAGASGADVAALARLHQRGDGYRVFLQPGAADGDGEGA